MAYVLRLTRTGKPTDTLWVEALGEAERLAKKAVNEGVEAVDIYEARLVKSDQQIRSSP